LFDILDSFISFSYRKQTKNQWARDDPAFAVAEAGFVAVSCLVITCFYALCIYIYIYLSAFMKLRYISFQLSVISLGQIATLAYAIAFQSPSFWGYLWSVLYGVIVDWLLVGLAVASTTSHIANKYLRQHHAHSVEQEVEWLYAFDVHTNAFFCSFFITYVLQYFLLPILLARGAIPCILSNGLYAIATIWYAYITHLGYRGTCTSAPGKNKVQKNQINTTFDIQMLTLIFFSSFCSIALSFLGNTQVFLWYPIVTIGFLLVLSIILLVLGLPINTTRIVMAFHYG
tara:strand:- start:1162 stop:2019 length:858 start_codon:yes stop_codon:yes gene_type:complete